MEQDPGNGGEDAKREPKDEAKPEPEIKIVPAEPDNTQEIIAAAVGGILTVVAGVFEVADHRIVALWTFFASLCSYIYSFGSYLHDRRLLWPACVLRSPKRSIAMIFAALATVARPPRRSQVHDTQL